MTQRDGLDEILGRLGPVVGVDAQALHDQVGLPVATVAGRTILAEQIFQAGQHPGGLLLRIEVLVRGGEDLRGSGVTVGRQ